MAHKKAALAGSGPTWKCPEPSLPAAWLQELHRLEHLEWFLPLLPVGWGSDGKAPMLAGWPEHHGFTVSDLQVHPGIRAVGARTGRSGPLLAFDFDGESSLQLGLDPTSVSTWQVHRDTDPHRLKVLFEPTPKQLSQLRDEFQGRTISGDGEALEVFFSGGRQVIVMGEHVKSGGSYSWPDGMGPEALAPPPAAWWHHALSIAASRPQPRRSSCRRGRTTLLNPCPVCGRDAGLWCSQTAAGLILCMPGVSFNAEERHGPLTIGQVVDGWALVKRTPIPEGDVLTFKVHRAGRWGNG